LFEFCYISPLQRYSYFFEIANKIKKKMIKVLIFDVLCLFLMAEFGNF